MSLLSPTLLWLVAVVAIGLLAYAVGIRSRLGLMQFAAAGLAAALILAGLYWAQNSYGLVPAGFPASYYAWVAVPILGLTVVAAGLAPSTLALVRRWWASIRSGRHIEPRERPRVFWRRVIAAAVAIPLGLTALTIKVNQDYDYYPTWSSLFSTPADNHVGFLQLVRAHRAAMTAGHHHHRSGPAIPAGVRVPADGPISTYGTAYHVPMPGLVSHFDARPGWIWVPSSYLREPLSKWPVVMLLAGSPGFTNDWIRAGHADVTADTFAAHHHGIAPIIVMPDDNGTFEGDTECVNGRRGDVETYLTVDVPAFLHNELGVGTHRDWAVAGLSEGGTCAAMLGLRHPGLFSVFADYSGLTSPTLTDHTNPTLATRQLFDGDRAAYDEHNPLWLLAHQPARDVRSIWVVGTDDHGAMHAQQTLTALARRSGLPVSASLVHDGSHSFALWSEAFAATLPMLMQDLEHPLPLRPTSLELQVTPPVRA